MSAPEEFAESKVAVQRLYDAMGSGFAFPGDAIWEHYNGSLPASGIRPGLITKLARDDFIVATGGTTKSVSQARKGSPAREYTFGTLIAPDSLTKALAVHSRSPVGGNEELPTVSSAYVQQEANPNGVHPLGLPLQRILHGCPGSGKSYAISKDANAAHYVIRTVFHPETRYSDFVGGLRPESIYRVAKNDTERMEFSGSTSDVPGEPYVQYVVQPGPLLRAYHLAYLDPDASVVLIIDELSRANAAHVFGDMIQLLDRREKDGDELSGCSEYEIEPRPEIRSWLNFHEVSHSQVAKGSMRFPPNLYIWATMNRSDQNARQLDSAFLRRWSKRYLSFKQIGSYDNAHIKYGGDLITWGNLRKAINLRLQKAEGVPEDKFVGPYFLPEQRLSEPASIYEDLWGYIWNDVLKTRASSFFEGASTFAELQDIWDDGKGSPIGSIGAEIVPDG